MAQTLDVIIIEEVNTTDLKSEMELNAEVGYTIASNLTITDDFAGNRLYTIVMSKTVEI